MKLGRRDFIGGVVAAMVLLSIAGGGVEQGMGTAAVEPFPDGARIVFIGDSITQNGVAVTWVAAHYRKKNSTLEMDFFLRRGDNLVPVEIKAGNTKAKSMRVLLDSPHYQDIKWGIKLVKGNVGFSNGVLTIPQWCAFFLRRLVKEPTLQFIH